MFYNCNKVLHFHINYIELDRQESLIDSREDSQS